MPSSAFALRVEAYNSEVGSRVGVACVFALSNAANQSLTLAIIFKAHLEQISFVSAGRRSVQLAIDFYFLRTSLTVSPTHFGRSQ